MSEENPDIEELDAPDGPGPDDAANNGSGGQGPTGGGSGDDGVPENPPIAIEDEVRKSFLDYSMSVIVSRALPDVRDGLKPVHRRILYAMNQEGLASNRPYSKCAGVVGEVLKHYHPHGDSAVYDALVRMVQDFSLRYPLIDGQGNFGSIDGDPAAAYRYTESRLRPLAEELLRDIDRETVDFAPNFDGSVEEPTVLPARVPNLLANGSAGIAVGMATNVPPHNMRELIDALMVELGDPDCTLDQLMEKMPGPDFPTGASICGREGIRNAYSTGRGLLAVRAKADFEEPKRGGRRIIISEIPFMVNKGALLERIADLVRDGKIDGVTDLRDESNRQGMRIVVVLRNDANEEVVLNKLYKMTPLQSTFGVNLLALVNGRPETLTLKQALRHFIDFRQEVIVRRATYDLAQAEARAHILEGFEIILEALDEAIAIIRAAADTAAARTALMERFSLTERQARAILEMRLRALTGMERQRVLDELAELRAKIADLKGLLESDARQLDVVRADLLEIHEKYGDERRTVITDAVLDLSTEDLIAEEDMVVTVSHSGYIKRNPITQYRAQRRGGKGVAGMGTREADFVENLFVASTHDYVLFFTNRGRVHWKKVYELPQLGRAARGKSLANILELQEDEKVQTTLSVRSFAEESNSFILICTLKGVVKKTKMDAYANPRRGGIIAINLADDDEVVSARRTEVSNEVIIASRSGKSIRFPEEQARAMGRTAGGVRGMALTAEDAVVGMEVLTPGANILTVTEKGYGKRTPLDEYRIQNRGGQGIITIRTSTRNGPVVGVAQVVDDDEVILITNGGKVLRCKVGGISQMGRATQGVRLMDLNDGEQIVAMARLADQVEPEVPAPAAVTEPAPDAAEEVAPAGSDDDASESTEDTPPDSGEEG